MSEMRETAEQLRMSRVTVPVLKVRIQRLEREHIKKEETEAFHSPESGVAECVGEKEQKGM
jgi:hypothetical protein